jgi:indole-3-glycerol phosphate synthase
MSVAVPDILQTIVQRKKAAVRGLVVGIDHFARAGEAAVAARRPFLEALRREPPAIIAEVKKASPSKGVFVEDFRPVEIASQYATGGAAAISVLTDEEFFQGSLHDLEAVRATVSLPVLRKDFTVHEVHVHQAAAHGADAILLIAAVLSADEMRSLRELAAGYQMDAIVEVHSADELEKALDSDPAIIGVNNRNLHNFEVSLETSLRLAEKIPAGVFRISESGIHTHSDLALLREAGYGAFLVGEHLMRSGDAGAALAALRNG